MKVAMLGWEFPPFVAGGLGVHCLELTKALSRQGVAVDFYMPRMEGRDGPLEVAARHRHLDIHEVEADASLDPYDTSSQPYEGDFARAVDSYNRRLVATFEPRGADLLHCHDWITAPAAMEIARRTGLPLVATIHSIENDRSAGLYPQAWIEDIERTIVHTADRVIAVSAYTRQLLHDAYGADMDKVDAIHNGIDAERFRGGPRTPTGTVLFLARLSRQKGPLFFLRAAKRVLEVLPEARFVVAGQGEMMSECIDYTLEHNIADRVRFAGYVPDEELPSFYGRHDVYVLSSVSEPFGITALEAMATGVPTIVTRTSGVGEGVRHAFKTPYWDVDEMADMIIRLLSAPELRAEMSEAAIQEVRRFTWAETARRTLESYATAIRTRKGLPPDHALWQTSAWQAPQANHGPDNLSPLPAGPLAVI